MTDKRPLIALVVVLALFAGAYTFGQWYFFEPTATLDNSDAPSTTTTTAYVDSDVAVATGDLADWQAGIDRITAIENELFANPDPSRVGEIMLPSCSCYQPTVDRLTALKQANQRVAGANIVLTETQFLNQDGNRVEIFTNPQPAGFPTIDSSGQTVEASPSRNNIPLLYTMDKTSDGWRLAERQVAGAAQ